jgi:uncharacterized damage-inducible protein DinB
VRANEVLAYGLEQVQALVERVVEGLDADALARPPAPGANTVAWLVWHLARVQDDHLAEAFADRTGGEQVWTSQGWADRFALPFGPEETGYGFSTEQVAQVRASAELLAGYAGAVQRRSAELLAGVDDDELERVVDESYDPPVTLGVRLSSVLGDDYQHVGQAAYVRGLLARG